MTEPSDSHYHGEEKTRVPIWLIVVGIIFVLGVIFVIQNTETAEMEFLFVKREFPVWVMLVIFFVVGFLTAEVWGYIRRRRRRNQSA